MAARRSSKKKSAKQSAARKQPVTKAARRQQILEAARDVFARKGYHQTTIDDIVAKAGVARGTFYLYFEDKRGVFAELIDRFSSRISMAITKIIIDAPQRPVPEQVRDNIHAILTVSLNERAMTKILFTDATGLDSAFDRKLATFYDEVVQLLSESLREGQAIGIVGDGEPRVMAYLTIGALKELLYQVVTLGLSADSADALTQQIYDFISNGYLREPPQVRRGSSRRQGR